MIAAVVKDDLVENVIVIEEAQLEEMAQALKCELVDARPYRLAIGDLRTPRGWTRNAGGEQMVLPELEPESYDSYTVAMKKVEAAQEEAEHSAEIATLEAQAIIKGDIDDPKKPALMMARKSLDSYVTKIAEVPKEINEHTDIIRNWRPAQYFVGDVRMYEDIPYKCVQEHDSFANQDWTPDKTPALWMQYHGTSKDTARPWLQPQGAHDQYRAGEWMIWSDATYECLQDTVYTPTDYAQAWRKDETDE